VLGLRPFALFNEFLLIKKKKNTFRKDNLKCIGCKQEILQKNYNMKFKKSTKSKKGRLLKVEVQSHKQIKPSPCLYRDFNSLEVCLFLSRQVTQI
jgi:hypothetical protein